MSAENKAYAVITGVETDQPGSVTQLGADARFGVVAPDGSLVGSPGTAIAVINYGDSTQKIRESLVAEIRRQAGDSALDVNFIP